MSSGARRGVARCVAGAVLALSAVIGPVAVAPEPAVAGPGTCNNGSEPGALAGDGIPWAQERLDFDRVHEFATGAGIKVAVIDSGLSRRHPHTALLKIESPTNVIGPPFPPGDLLDCTPNGHGTGVAAIIGAPAVPNIGFRGLAPDATIVPIKQDDPDVDNAGTTANAARGIDAALAAGARVINMSLDINLNEPPLDLKAAVQRALDANVVIVAAAGNLVQGEGQGGLRWPAAFADTFPNVLAVGATDQSDQLIPESVHGSYVNISAPGAAIDHPTPDERYTAEDGTSFATPFVSATAALVRERYPRLTAAQVVRRIEQTADRPGVSVPDDGYGWGIVNPYRAVTAVRDDTLKEPKPAPPEAVTPPDLPEPPDRTLQNVAYGVAAGLLGAAALFGIATVVWRHTTDRRRAMAGEDRPAVGD